MFVCAFFPQILLCTSLQDIFQSHILIFFLSMFNALSFIRVCSQVFLLALDAFLTFLTYENRCHFSRQRLNATSFMKPFLIIEMKINVRPFQTTKTYDTESYT